MSRRYAKDLPRAGLSVHDEKMLGVGSVVGDLGW